MAPPANSPSNATAQVYIDLTDDVSNDEDAPIAPIVPKANGQLYQHSQQLRPYNHGLPSASYLDLSTNRALGTNYMMRRTQSGHRNSISSSRRSFTSRNSSPDHRPSSRSTPVVLISSRGSEALGINSAIESDSGVKRQKTGHNGTLPGAGVQSTILPQQQVQAQLPSSNSRKAMNGSSVTRGASRTAAISAVMRVSDAGRIQKPRVKKPGECDPMTRKVLKEQVIPHCAEATRQYRVEMSMQNRTKFGQKIASDVVGDPRFLQDLAENGDHISEECEEHLALVARKSAAKNFRRFRDKPMNPQTKTRRNVQHLHESNFNGIVHIERMASEASTDADEVFESHSVHNTWQPANDRLSLRSSFSPATSFSNEAVDVVSPAVEVPDNSREDLDSNVKSLPKRSTRAVEPVYARPKRTRAKRKNSQEGISGLNISVPHRTVDALTEDLKTPNNLEMYQMKLTASKVQLAVLKEQVAVTEEIIVPEDEIAVREEHLVVRERRPKTTQGVVNLLESSLRPETPAFDQQLHNPINKLLRERELHGTTQINARRGLSSFKAFTVSYLEDCFVQQSEWTDCSGTILTLTWTSPDAFICGAVAHSDTHHMQYNKPGNLLLGSTLHDTLRSFPDHRTVRPLVSASENASNALEAMRQTQDPWIYSPVVSSAHSEKTGLTFTASFDKTVKIWSLAHDGSSMELKGTWEHDDRVNIVAASPHHDRVATASASMSNAVRVYNLDEDAISYSSYDEYCGNKASEQAGEVHRRETWAYFPSTMQWGIADRVKYLLLVGWSPRSDSGDDEDIAAGKRNTGELCLWNSLDSSRIPVHSARSQNVFEVIWHPTQPSFLVASSPSGSYDADTVKTQIRLFGLNATGAFVNNRTFDCPAWDINELTIMPNSQEECYATASCTNGRTYVYDSKQGDQPIHILKHGDALDEAEDEDSGVKFACWGQSSDRFYTGSSDGHVMAWDIKAPVGKPFVRTVLKAAGGIYAGAFSKDFSKLIIGDDTGTVHLLAMDDSDLSDEVVPIQKNSAAVLGASVSNGLLPRNIKRPKLVIPHPEPPSPYDPDIMQDVEDTTVEISNRYLEEGQLRFYPNSDFPNACKAVFQGPNYSETLLYRFDAHEEEDASKPLLPQFLQKQQFSLAEKEQDGKNRQEAKRIFEQYRKIHRPSVSSDLQAHQKNIDLDLDFVKLSLSTQKELRRDRVELEGDFMFDYELLPSRNHVFLGERSKRRGEELRSHDFSKSRSKSLSYSPESS